LRGVIYQRSCQRRHLLQPAVSSLAARPRVRAGRASARP